MELLESDLLGITGSQGPDEEIKSHLISALPTSDPSSSNCDTSSADATTDGFEGGMASEAHTDSSSAIEFSSPFSGSIDELEDHEILDMLQKGELNYSIEKDSGYEAEDCETDPHEIDRPSSPIDCETVSPSKKRTSENDDIILSIDHHVDKKPKLEETYLSNPLHLSIPPNPTNPNPNENLTEDVQSDSNKDPDIPTAPKSDILTSTPPTPVKAPTRSRAPPQTHSTTTMVTRTRAMTAMSASGQEIVVPEHSHTLPKWMPRAPIRAIEIPVWHIRSTYEEEDAIREAYQAQRVSALHLSSLESASLSDLESRFMRLADATLLHNNGNNSSDSGSKANQTKTSTSDASMSLDSDEEELGDDEYYAVRHYRYEIQERLRWASGPGSDRFSQEDRHMTVDKFRTHELWHTYLQNGNSKLLPPEKWAQNMAVPPPKPSKPIRKEKSSDGSPARPVSSASKGMSKPAAPMVIPKGFVLKIKSASGTAVIRSIPESSSSAPLSSHMTPLPFPSAPKKHYSTKPFLTPQRPIVKKAGALSIGAGVAPSTAPPRFTLKKSSSTTLSTTAPAEPILATKPILAKPSNPAVVTHSKPPSTLVVKFGAKKFGTVGVAAPSTPSHSLHNGAPLPSPLPTLEGNGAPLPSPLPTLEGNGSSHPSPTALVLKPGPTLG